MQVSNHLINHLEPVVRDQLGCLVTFPLNEMSLVVGKPAFCICENKDADQHRGNREANVTADQRLCFRHIYYAQYI